MLSGFSNFAGLDAAGADLHSFITARRQLYANGLQIGIENAGRSVVGVRNIIAKLRSFAANFTTLCHDYEISCRYARPHCADRREYLKRKP